MCIYVHVYIYICWYHCSFEEEKSKKEEEEKADKKPEEDLCCCVWLHFREPKGRLTNVLPPLICWIEGEHALRLLVQLVKLSSRKFGRIAGTVTTEGKWWGRERGATRAGLFPVLDALYHLNPLKELLGPRKRRKPRMGKKMLRSQQRHLNSAI